MGFITIPDPYSHRSKYTLFTPEECIRLSKILLRDERMVLDIPNDDDNLYEGLTHQFPVYNWLNNPDLLEFDIPKRLFTLPEFQDESILYVQCWVNILRQGEKIPHHVHGHPKELGHKDFYASNTFISGPEDTGTHYNDTYERNEIGTMNLIGSMVPHEVKTHMSHTPRISMAMDIHDGQSKLIKNAIIDTSTTFISPQSIKNRFKRITNRFNL